jgi:predicted PurR-regulated permease PerM
MDRVIAGFVRGRLTICLCQIVLFTIAYLIIGVPAAFIVGPIVGLLTLVPYGASLGMPVAMLLMALSPTLHNDFRDSWWFIIGAPVLVQGISQVLDDYILTPKIQGKNTDMSMPMILFASIAGGVLGGVYGLLLAIPVAACAKILYLELLVPRLKAWAAGKAADPLPFSR